MTVDAGRTAKPADTATTWWALASAAEGAKCHLPDETVAALVCAAHGVAPGGMRTNARCEFPSDEEVEILDALGRAIWSGGRTVCPDVSAVGALDLSEALPPGWKHMVDEGDSSVEVEMRGPGDPGDPVRASGTTLALGLTAALCRAMIRVREGQAMREHCFLQQQSLRALAGSQVTAATIREMAFCEPLPDGTCVFEDARFLFVQADLLELALSGRGTVRFSTWQGDDFALEVALAEPSLSPGREEPGSIFRERIMPEFPTGTIDGVDWWADADGCIQEVSLRIAGRHVFLRAGEVEECEDRAAIIRDRDESVLIFLDRDAYANTTFNARV